MWCRLFRREPSWKREATRAEVWLQETEAEEEVLAPEVSPCRGDGDTSGGWWFHNGEHHPFRSLLGSPNCQTCGLPRKPSDVECERWRKLGETYFNTSGSVVGDTAETSPTVGETFGSPPWGNANQMLDAIEAAIAEHQPFVSRDGLVRCQACGWWGLWPYDKTVNQVIAPHQARVVMDMVQAEHRIANTGKTAQ